MPFNAVFEQSIARETMKDARTRDQCTN